MHTKRRGRCAGGLVQCWVQQVFDVQWSVSMLGASAAALHSSAPTSRPTYAWCLVFTSTLMQEAHAQADEYQKKWGRAKVQRDGKEWGM